jgi:hypothetical protein
VRTAIRFLFMFVANQTSVWIALSRATHSAARGIALAFAVVSFGAAVSFAIVSSLGFAGVRVGDKAYNIGVAVGALTLYTALVCVTRNYATSIALLSLHLALSSAAGLTAKHVM